MRFNTPYPEGDFTPVEKVGIRKDKRIMTCPLQSFCQTAAETMHAMLQTFVGSLSKHHDLDLWTNEYSEIG